MVYVLFFLSGAAALVYEIAWSRQLGLFFGHTVHAAAIVLGAYFAGMAIGNRLAGRWAQLLARPLRGYAAAELAVAGWAAVTPALIHLYARPELAALLNHDSAPVQLAVRAAAAFFTLLPATVALGATLPLIAQYVSPPHAPRPRYIALAYAANTAGAFSGVAVATGVLILHLGVTGSGWLAAGISALCGVAAWLLPAGIAARKRTAVRRSAVPPRISPSWYVLAAVSGFGTLALQVLYTRLFALVMQCSTYAFGGVVAVFLAALALGAWLAARLVRRVSAPALALGACGLGAVAIPLSVVVFQRVTQLSGIVSTGDYWHYILQLGGLLILTTLVPVTLLGIVLPAAFAAVTINGGGGPGPAVGQLTAVNTIAAAAGALLASFVLLPQAGLYPAFALLAALYLLTALIAGAARWGSARLALPAVGAAALTAMGIAAALLPPRGSAADAQRTLWQRESAYGLISVTETATGERTLRQNNNYRLGANYGIEMERRQAHLPLLLHPAPREVACLGLATGITAGAALAHPEVERLTAIELVPDVVTGAAYFERWNNGVLSDPRATVVVNDARHYLYATGGSFDVIISDLFVPWHSQTGYLYTVEHYRAARNRLAPGGVFCQWLALYEIAPRELETIAAGFASVFPNATVWRDSTAGRYPLIALVGTEQPLRLDGTQLIARWATVRSALYPPDPMIVQGTDILGCFIGRWEQSAGMPLNTDDHPRVEFLAPLSDGRHDTLSGARLREYYDSVLLGLPLAGVEYVPRRGEPAPDLGAGRVAQRESVRNAPAQQQRRLY